MLAEGLLELVLRFMEGGPAPEACAGKPGICAMWREAGQTPGEVRWRDGGAEIWMRPLRNGDRALALINRGQQAVAIDVIWKEHGLAGSPRVFDVGSRKRRGRVQGGFAERVEPAGVVMLRVRP